MPLPSSWVDRLFAKLTVRYGAAFMRQYGDLDVALVKADWAEVLDGFDHLDGAISYALRYMPAGKPPNALEFRDQCRRAPEPKPVALLEGPPPANPDPQRLAEALSKLRQTSAERASMSPAEWCARNIRRIAAERGFMSSVQAEMVAFEAQRRGIE